MTTPRQRTVVVHIEALDLSSVPLARHHAVTAAFTRELEALLAEAPPLEHPVRPGGTLLTPPLRLAPTAPPERLGAALARAVHAGLTGSGGSPLHAARRAQPTDNGRSFPDAGDSAPEARTDGWGRGSLRGSRRR